MFFTLLRYWVRGGGGSPKLLAHNLLSKIEIFETCFFDIVTTQNDHPRYVKHVLGRIYVFFTLFRCWVRGGGGGGVSQGIGTQPAYAVFHPGQLKNRSFRTCFYDIVTT